MDAFDATSVADDFQLGRPLGALEFIALGQKNPLGVCRLITDSGSFAVKRFDTAPHTNALAIETAAFNSGLPMPRPMRTRDGQPFASYRHGSRTHWVRVYQWVPGTALDWGCADPNISIEIGKLMAAVHGLSAAAKDLQEDPAMQWSALTETGWTKFFDCAAAHRVPWAQALRRAIPLLLEREAYLARNDAEREATVPSQRDLHPPNIVRAPDSRLYVVDWDSAGPVVARHDVAKYALVWATPENGQPLPAAVHAFIDGYREGGGRYKSQGPSDLLYRQKTLHWWLAFNIRRDLSDQPGPDPDLTRALLDRAVSWDTAELEHLSKLLDY